MPEAATAEVPTSARRASPTAELAAATAFLTRVPVASVSGRTGSAAFGLVGGLLGLVASVPLLVLAPAHPVLGAIAAIAILAVLSGGLHLDGLADTFDALAAPSGGADRARTDPRAGTAGLIAVVLVLGVDVAALAELGGRGALPAAVALVAAATVSRAAAPAWGALVGRDRAPAAGLGTWFAASTSGLAAAVAVASAAILVLVGVEVAGPRVALAAGIGVLLGSVLTAMIVAARRQLDGDGYGALVEITFAAVLGAAAVIG